MINNTVSFIQDYMSITPIKRYKKLFLKQIYLYLGSPKTIEIQKYNKNQITIYSIIKLITRTKNEQIVVLTESKRI